MHHAIFCASVEIFRLLKIGVHPDRQSQGKITALMWAAAEGHVDVARLLVAAGADPSLQSSLGADSLKLAQQSIADEALKVEMEVRRPSPHCSSSLGRAQPPQPAHSTPALCEPLGDSPHRLQAVGEEAR